MEREKIIEEIIATAQMQADRYAKLVDLADEQQSILLSNNHSELSQNLSKFDQQLIEVMQINKRENSLFERLNQLQADGPYPRLSDTDMRYRELAMGVEESANRLRELTEANRQLLTGAMEFVNFSFGIICKAVTEASGLNGICNSNPAIVLDTKV